MLSLDVYKFDPETGRTSQTEVAKTVTAETYDIFFGTIEDILGLLDAVSDTSDTDAIIHAVVDNWGKLCILLLDVFPDLTREDLAHIKARDVIPTLMQLFAFVVSNFKGSSVLKNG